ncbi:MAG TPA: VTT domain-containing protein [Symbiobacteriaceae bacterium]|nr:VTT domain-containing protein [Symbiobacteriaceae bacterium]
MMMQTSTATAAAVFAAGLLEGVGVPWPGAVIIAGAAASLGNGGVDIPLVGLCFTAGYCLGSIVQYVLGRLLGPVILNWLPATQRAKLDALTARHGTAVVLWTRPLAAGNYVSIPAGMIRMPVPKFVLYTFLGIAPWAASMAAGGWFLGGQVEAISALLAQWFLPGILLFAGGLALVKLVKMLRHRTTATA